MSTLRHSPASLVWRALLVFLILSVADLFLTRKLIYGGEGAVFESNPVANWCLTTYGWGGLTAFKLGIVSVIGILAGSLAFWRPRTSELILVFACGAQSAVVLYSLFLSRCGEFPPDGRVSYVPLAGAENPQRVPPQLPPENSLYRLLTQPEIQEELQLSQSQVKAVQIQVDERQGLFTRFRQLSREEWTERSARLLASEKALTDDLELKQVERLKQIARQQRGIFAFQDSEVIEELQLSAEQQARIQQLLAERVGPRPMHPRMPFPRPGASRSVEERIDPIRDQALAILTAEQLARWKELLGEPFKGDLRLRPFNPHGPGRPFAPAL